MAVCNGCGVVLSDDNWLPSCQRKHYYTCKLCVKEQNDKRNVYQNKQNLYINGKYISRNDPRYRIFKPGNYKNINDAIFEQSPASTIKEGYVYVITNKAWPDWVKIGMAIDAEDRLSGYQTSSPHRDYILEHSVYSNERRKAEQQAHSRAAKLAIEVNGEWFKLTVQQAIEVLDNLDEYRRETIKETNTNTSKDKLQEQPIQADFWAYAENR
jgi:gamma-glutamylcyclotransferase (GGCT)/AIG2-like uncharacterized protein YtfP